MKELSALALGAALIVGAAGGIGQAAAETANDDATQRPTYMGYTGTDWQRDFGITRGRCDREAVAAALGTPEAASAGTPPVAVLAGLDIDGPDRSCAAQALELLRNHRTVRWQGKAGRFSLTTGRDAVVDGRPCRMFVLVTGGSRRLGTACQTTPGIWELVRS